MQRQRLDLPADPPSGPDGRLCHYTQRCQHYFVLWLRTGLGPHQLGPRPLRPLQPLGKADTLVGMKIRYVLIITLAALVVAAMGLASNSRRSASLATALVAKDQSGGDVAADLLN